MKAAKHLKLLFTILISQIAILSCSKSPDPAPVTPPNTTTGITVTTNTVSQITATAGYSGGTVTLISGGSPITQRGLCWSTTPNPTTANNTSSDGSVPGQFYRHITNLTAATTYYVRAFASNSIGTTYGNQVSFTTTSSVIPPPLSTDALTSLMPYSAVCGGNIFNDGGAAVTARGVCWSTTPTPTIANSKTTDGTGTGVFLSNITGLTANTTYYLRSYATNSAGTGYGDEITFKTPEHGTVYFGCTDNNFYAVNSLTGQLKWKRTSSPGFGYAGPCYANGKVYTGGIDSYLYCLDTLTGNVIWSFLAGNTGIECDPVYDNGTIYFGSNDDNFYALDANTGALKWKYLTGANVSSSPVINNGVAYFGSADSKVYALNTTTGQLIWSFQAGGMIVAAGPTLANGILYIGSRTGILFAIDINTGASIWENAYPGTLEHVSPTVVNNMLYITSNNKVYAMQANTGQLVWEKTFASGFSTSAPLVVNGRLFIGGVGEFIALDALNGQLLWSKSILPNGASPTVMNDIVYIAGGGTSFFYAYDVLNGSEKWKFPITGLIVSGPCVVTASSVKHSGASGMQQ